MSGSERRNRERCSICQGPTVVSNDTFSGLRCRNSLCAFNHQHIKCSRCSHAGPEATEFDTAGRFHYYCRECQHKWVQPKDQ